MLDVAKLVERLEAITKALQDEAAKGDWPKEAEHLLAVLIADLKAQKEVVMQFNAWVDPDAWIDTWETEGFLTLHANQEAEECSPIEVTITRREVPE